MTFVPGTPAGPDGSSKRFHRSVQDDEGVDLLTDVLGLSVLGTAIVVLFTAWVLHGVVRGAVRS